MLATPMLEDKDGVLEMLEDIKKKDFLYPWQYSGLADLEKAKSYDEWVQEKKDEQKGIKLKEGYVKATTLLLKRVKDNKICGCVNIRHKLNDFLFKCGGHVGYTIACSERGKGYSIIALQKALEKLKEMNIEKVLITADVKNTASNKTIIACGGILENTAFWNQEEMNRYWINLE